MTFPLTRSRLGSSLALISWQLARGGASSSSIVTWRAAATFARFLSDGLPSPGLQIRHRGPGNPSQLGKRGLGHPSSPAELDEVRGEVPRQWVERAQRVSHRPIY